VYYRQEIAIFEPNNPSPIQNQLIYIFTMNPIRLRLPLMFVFLISLLITDAQNGTKLFTLEDFTNYTFYPRGSRGLRSMADGEPIHLLNREGQNWLSGAMKREIPLKTLLDLKKLNNEKLNAINDYAFSSDESKVLLTTDQEAIYRRLFTASYYNFDLKTSMLKPLSENGKQQLATFSPDGNKVAFVRHNNLFYTDLVSGKEIQLTDDGKFNFVINGAPDWVYEEEFEFNQAYEWSPDSKTLAWIRFDESGYRIQHEHVPGSRTVAG
jgi:dipeptidyl-peptidase-4